MRVIVCSKVGGLESMSIQEQARPKPKIGQVLVKVVAIGVNRADILQRRGKYPPPPDHSDILGLEIAGEVVEIGSNGTENDEIKIGQRVCGLVNGGAYAEYCLLDSKMVIKIPAAMKYTEAAGIPEAFLTAYSALFELGDLQAKESVLIHAGGSGVGTAAIQLAKVAGAKPYVTVGSDGKLVKAVALGAKGGVNHKAHDFAVTLMQMTKQAGINVIIDCVGELYSSRNIIILSTGGRLIQIAAMSGVHCHWDLGDIMRKRLQIKGLTMRSRPLTEKRLLTKQFVQKWLPYFESKDIVPVIDSVFPFEKVQQAHSHMESNKNFGKIILEL